MKKLLIAIAALSCAGTAFAESPKWNLVGISYDSVDADDISASGFGIEGSLLVSDNAFLAATYGRASDTVESMGVDVDVDVTGLSLGVGYRHALADNTDLFGILSYERGEVDASAMGYSADESDSGYSLSAGVRSMLTDAVELSGSVDYLDMGDASDIGFSLGAHYHFTPQFSVGAGYSTMDDVDSTSLIGRFYF